jgi:hypothetical protein
VTFAGCLTEVGFFLPAEKNLETQLSCTLSRILPVRHAGFPMI